AITAKPRPCIDHAAIRGSQHRITRLAGDRKALVARIVIGSDDRTAGRPGPVDVVFARRFAGGGRDGGGGGHGRGGDGRRPGGRGGGGGGAGGGRGLRGPPMHRPPVRSAGGLPPVCWPPAWTPPLTGRPPAGPRAGPGRPRSRWGCRGCSTS